MNVNVAPACVEIREVYQGPRGKTIVVAQLVSGRPRGSMILRSEESGDHWRISGGGVLAGNQATALGTRGTSLDRQRQGIETLVLERVDGDQILHTGERLLAEP